MKPQAHRAHCGQAGGAVGAHRCPPNWFSRCCEKDHRALRHIAILFDDSLANGGCISQMEDTSKAAPQFATAEFAPNPQTMSCGACKRPITGTYFKINGVTACPACAQKVRTQMPADSHAAFARGVAFGIAGAIAGCALYVTFALVTGLVIGWISLAVGFIVGKAMSFGSGGVGGRRYQMLAALLTYLAVSMAAVPIAIHQMKEHRAQLQSSEAAAPPRAHMSAPRAIGVLVLVGVASPLLALQDPLHGLIGLIILFVGIRFAWRFTAGHPLAVSGPYTPSAAGVI